MSPLGDDNGGLLAFAEVATGPDAWAGLDLLGDTGTGRTRTALVSVRAADDLPELPVLADMWVTELDPEDAEAVAAAIVRLRSAEEQLTEYRRALHERLDEATAELIARYRRDPASALVAFRSPHTGAGRTGSMA